jgi:hypothetical protein
MAGEYVYSFEVMQADDEPQLWLVCAECFVPVRAEHFNQHWEWHVKCGHLGA